MANHWMRRQKWGEEISLINFCAISLSPSSLSLSLFTGKRSHVGKEGEVACGVERRGCDEFNQHKKLFPNKIIQYSLLCRRLLKLLQEWENFRKQTFQLSFNRFLVTYQFPYIPFTISLIKKVKSWGEMSKKSSSAASTRRQKRGEIIKKNGVKLRLI